MTQIIADRVYQSTNTTGTGPYELGQVMPGGYRAFSAAPGITDGDTVDVYVDQQDGRDWEVGSYTYRESGQLERTLIRASSNAGTAVNWAPGTRRIALTFAAHSVAEVYDSAANTLANLNDFKVRYYGSAASDPATDPLGGAPALGATYYNTTSQIVRVFGSGGWSNFPGVSGTELLSPSGSGLVGYSGTVNYAVGTIGSVLHDAVVNPRMFPWLAPMDGIGDDTAAVNAALFSISVARGGTVDLGDYKVRLLGDIIVPAGCALTGRWTNPDQVGFASAPTYSQYGGIRKASTSKIIMGQSATICNLMIIRDGMTFPAGGESLFAGTAIESTSNTGCFRNLLVMGFNKLFAGTGQRYLFERVFGDNRNGLDIEGSFDVCYINKCHMWPFAENTNVYPNTAVERSGIAYYIHDVGDWTKITDCFSYGYFRGYQITNANSVTITGSAADHNFPRVQAGAIGFLVNGTSNDTKISLGQSAAQAIGVYIDTAPGMHTEILAHTAWATDDHSILVVNGDASIIGGGLRDTVNGVTVLNPASHVLIDGVRYRNISALPIQQPAGANQVIVGINDYGDFAGDPAGAPKASGKAIDATRTGTTTTKRRNLQEKLQDLPHFLDYSVDPTGGNDSTSEFVKMVADCKAGNFRRIYGTDGTFVLSAPVLVDAPIWIDGAGTQPYTSIVAPNNVRGRGTWFHLAHGGIGFDVAGTLLTGAKFSGIGTYRDQPVPGVTTYTPNNHDWDFNTNGVADIDFEDVMLLNATRGIRCLSAGQGRINLRNIKGQPLMTGLQIDEAYDVCRIHDVHFWPFWAFNDFVNAYTIANGTGIRTVRNDNPFMSNLFTIFYGVGLDVASSAAGTTNKLKVVNADFDRGATGVRVSANGHVGTYVNVSAQGEPGLGLTNNGFHVTGANNEIGLVAPDFRVHGSNAVRVEGTGNRIEIVTPKIDAYNQQNAGFPAIEALVGNTITIVGEVAATNGNGAPKLGGAGRIYSEEWLAFTPVLTAGSGLLLVASAVCKYKVLGKTVTAQITATVTNAGTAGGRLICTLPIAPSVTGAIGSGRENNVTGDTLTVVCPVAGVASADIYTYNNAYPAPSGSSVSVTVVYEIA